MIGGEEERRKERDKMEEEEGWEDGDVSRKKGKMDTMKERRGGRWMWWRGEGEEGRKVNTMKRWRHGGKEMWMWLRAGGKNERQILWWRREGRNLREILGRKYVILWYYPYCPKLTVLSIKKKFHANLINTYEEMCSGSETTCTVCNLLEYSDYFCCCQIIQILNFFGLRPEDGSCSLPEIWAFAGGWGGGGFCCLQHRRDLPSPSEYPDLPSVSTVLYPIGMCSVMCDPWRGRIWIRHCCCVLWQDV
jgi:hypothetical protein